MNSKIIFQQIPIGPMQNFAYLIGCPETRQAAVFDCGFEARKVFQIAKSLDLAISDLFLTHVHYDHSGAAEELQKLTSCNIWMNPASRWKQGHEKEGHWVIPRNHKTIDANTMSITFENITGSVLRTPGHQADHLSFIVDKYFIAGDALFIDGSGRVDLPDSDSDAAIKTLEMISTLDDGLIICPGHDYGSVSLDTLGNQKKTNPHLADPQARLG